MNTSDFDRALHILLVDDDEVDRLRMRRFLSQADFPVTIDELSDSARIVERVNAVKYDCIILDYQLGDETGEDVIRRLVAANNTTPILVVAGQDEQLGAELVALGAADFLSKDEVTPLRLARRLRYVHQLSGARKRAAQAHQRTEHVRRQLLMTLGALPTGVVVADHNCVYLYSNPLADAVFGKEYGWLTTACDSSDHACPIDLGTEDEAATSATALAISMMEPMLSGSDLHVECRALNFGGARYRLTVTPILNDNDALHMVVLTLDDVTAEMVAKEAAERAARARQEILAVVSHDLRGPLSAIAVAMDGLSDDTVVGDDRKRYAAAVGRSVQRADRLVRDLLLAAQFEAGTVEVTLASVSVADIMTQAQRDHELTAKAAHVELVLGDIPNVSINADRERILQALANLVLNALRHATGTQRIVLSARATDSAVELIVRDFGPGVPVETVDKLFRPFWQGEGHDRNAGAGLGLAIVRGIARTHSGDAAVRNLAEGGAEFSIVLPTHNAAFVS